MTASVAILLHALRRYDVDDAWIHLRVAHNWATGHGPVWNVGERVEASTSPAWLALLTLGMWLGFDGPTWAQLASTASAAAVGAGVVALAHRLSAEHRAAAGLAAAVLTASTFSFSYWASTRMEVAFAAALALAAIDRALATRSAGGAIVTGLVAAVASLARPELTAVIPLVVGLAAVQVAPERRWKALLFGLVAAAVVVAAHLSARVAFYGSLVPNTYVAKVQGLPLASRVRGGLELLASFLEFHPVLVALLAWVLVVERGNRRLVAALCLCFVAATAWTGGDHFTLARLTVPLVPAMCALGGAVLVQSGSRAGRFAVAAALLLQAPWAVQRARVRVGHSARFVAQQASIAGSVARLPPGAVASCAIGVVGYLSPARRIIDLVGLADAHIARTPHLPGVQLGHDHADPAYVLEQAPAYVFPMSLESDHPVGDAEELAALSRAHEWYAAGHALVQSPEFRGRYRGVNLRLADGKFFRMWARRDIPLDSASAAQ